MSNIKIGNSIIIVNNEYISYDEKGKISAIRSGELNIAMYYIEFNENRLWNNWYIKRDFEVIVNKFSIGDQVEILEEENDYYEQTGTVVAIKDKDYCIRINNNEYTIVYEIDLGEIQMNDNKLFNIGDLVRIKYGYYYGLNAKIVAISDNEYQCFNINNAGAIWYKENEIEKTGTKLDDIIEVRLKELKCELELHDWNKFENIITSYFEKKRNREELKQLELLENYREEFMSSLQNLESGSYFFYDGEDWMPCRILHHGRMIELEATGYTIINLPADIRFDWKIGNKIMENYDA